MLLGVRRGLSHFSGEEQGVRLAWNLRGSSGGARLGAHVFGGHVSRTNGKGSSSRGGHLLFTGCEAGPRTTLRSEGDLFPVLRIVEAQAVINGDIRKHDLILW